MSTQNENNISPLNILSGGAVAEYHSNFNRDLGMLISINAKLNEVAGNPAYSHTLTDDEVDARIRHQCGLIAEEVEETLHGLAEQNKILVRDGLADVLVTITGLLHRAFPTDQHLWDFDKMMIPGQVYYPSETLEMAVNALSNIGGAFRAVSTGDLGIDKGQMLQACFQLVTFVKLFSSICNIPLRQDHESVSVSNMSKFDTDMEAAQLTVAKYTALGIDVEIRETVYDDVAYFVVVSAKDQEAEMFDSDGESNGIRQFPKGKFLKSVNYKEPEFIEADIVLPQILKNDVQESAIPTGEASNDDAQ